MTFALPCFLTILSLWIRLKNTVFQTIYKVYKRHKYPFLKSHPQYQIAKKQMRLGGNVVAFEVKGGIEAGRNFLDKIKLCSLSANLGDTRTIVTHPASTTHSKLITEERLAVCITDGLVRVSVGLETVSDVIADLSQALEK